ncbi:MAG: hypothetical protein CMJ23_14155 [Phycisphaerae bacterium]|nr:hypothetical protein [Phycisphaerae bacterium]
MSSGGTKTPLVVTAELPCRRCRHLLRGLGIDGLCPECGLPIEETLRSSIDLESLRGRAFARPKLVAAAILLLATATAFSVLGNLILPLTTVIARAPDAGVAEATQGLGPLATGMFFILVVMILGGLAAIAGVLSLLRSDAENLLDRPEKLRWLGMVIGSGLLVWLSSRFLSITPGVNTRTDLMLQFALVDLLVTSTAVLSTTGLRRLLKTIGQRSEQYIRAGKGLQTTKPMIAGLGINMALGFAWFLLIRNLDPISTGGLEENLATVRLVLGALISLGGLYLMANAIWATSPLRRRESSIDQLVGPDSPASMADARPPGDTP